MKLISFNIDKWINDNDIDIVTKDGRICKIIEYNEGITRPITVVIDGRYYLYREDGTMCYEHPEDNLFIVEYDECDFSQHEKLVKSIIEAYATTKDNEYHLPIPTCKTLSKKLIETAKKDLDLPRLIPEPMKPGSCYIENGYLKYAGFMVKIEDLIEKLPIIGNEMYDDPSKIRKSIEIAPPKDTPSWRQCEWNFRKWEISDEDGEPILNDGLGHCINLKDLMNLPIK